MTLRKAQAVVARMLDQLTFRLHQSLTLMTVGLAASYIPARRAARVDPVMALRYD